MFVVVLKINIQVSEIYSDGKKTLGAEFWLGREEKWLNMSEQR